MRMKKTDLVQPNSGCAQRQTGLMPLLMQGLRAQRNETYVHRAHAIFRKTITDDPPSRFAAMDGRLITEYDWDVLLVIRNRRP